MTEKELVEGCKNGKYECQKHLYEKYYPMVMGVCMRYMKNRMLAEDILHDTFIKALTKIDTYHGDGQLSGWLKKITVYTAINEWHKNTEKRCEVDIDECNDLITDTSVLQSDSRMVNLILKFIDELPEGYKNAFILYEIDGYSHKEISDMLGCKLVTVRTQLRKAKCKLKEKINRHLKNKNETL